VGLFLALSVAYVSRSRRKSLREKPRKPLTAVAGLDTIREPVFP